MSNSIGAMSTICTYIIIKSRRGSDTKLYSLLCMLVVHACQLVPVSLRTCWSCTATVTAQPFVYEACSEGLVGEGVRPVDKVTDSCGCYAYEAAHNYVLFVVSLRRDAM